MIDYIKMMGISPKTTLFFVLFCSLFTVSNLAANETMTLRGKVVSDIDGEIIPYALIRVKQIVSFQSRADDEGFFRIALTRPGIYSIKASIKGDLNGESAWINIDTATFNNEQILELKLNLSGLAIELSVTEDNPNRQLSEFKITKQDLDRVAGASGDAFWVMQTLPGVAIGDDGSPEPAVRGSFPGDNLYYVDFLPIGYLYHAGGSISVVDGNFIRNVNFYPSAFGPEHGDKLGGTFDLNLIEPNTQQWQHNMGFSLLGFTLGTQGPVTENQSVFIGVRRSFLDLVIKLIDWEEKSDNEIIVAPRYDDYQFKYKLKANRNNSIYFHLNGARDKSITDLNASGDPWIEEIDKFYHAQAIVWDSFQGNHYSKMALGYLTNNSLDIDGPQSETRYETKNFFLREKIYYQLNNNHAITLGGDLSTQERRYYNDWRISCDEGFCRQISDINKRINFGAAYLKDKWHVTDRLSVSIGARLNGNDLVKQLYLDPRLGLEWRFTPQTTFTTAWGRHNQIPNFDAEFGPWGKANLEHYRADHYVAGVTHQLNKQWRWKTELFYKKLWNLLAWDFDKGINTNNGSGKAYGAELFIKKDFSHQLSGWLSMTYSRTKFKNKPSNDLLPTDFDQPIIATLILSKQFSNDWYFGLKWYFHSGRPYTPIIDGTPVINDETGEISHYRPVYGDYNSARYPVYHRLDVRISKQVKFSNWELKWFFALINAYNRKNVEDYDYSFDKKSKIPNYQLPLFPSFGFSARF